MSVISKQARKIRGTEQSVRLDSVCKIFHGGTPSKEVSKYWKGNIPWVSPKDMWVETITDSEDHISSEAIENSATRLVPTDSLLVVIRSGILARKFPVSITAREVSYNQDIKALVVNRDKADPRFLFMLLRAKESLILADGVKKGATVHSLRSGFLESLLIPLPSLSEQRGISTRLHEQLGAVERARAAVEEQLQTAEVLTASFLHAVFSSPTAQKWKWMKIRDFAETCSGTTPSRGRKEFFGGKIPWVKTGELVDGMIFNTEEHITETALKETCLRLLPKETLLVAMYGQGQTRGRTGLLQCEATTNQACFAILPAARFKPLFLQYWFRHSYLRLREKTESRGGNQPNLNGNVLRGENVPMPPVQEQKLICDRLTEELHGAQALREHLTGRLAAIEKLPSTLLREAFSGKI